MFISEIRGIESHPELKEGIGIVLEAKESKLHIREQNHQIGYQEKCGIVSEANPKGGKMKGEKKVVSNIKKSTDTVIVGSKTIEVLGTWGGSSALSGQKKGKF